MAALQIALERVDEHVLWDQLNPTEKRMTAHAKQLIPQPDGDVDGVRAPVYTSSPIYGPMSPQEGTRRSGRSETPWKPPGRARSDVRESKKTMTPFFGAMVRTTVK
jgi:hypothetical protein